MAFQTTVFVPAGQTLTITADVNSAGSYWLAPNPLGGDPGSPTSVSASSSKIVAPLVSDQTYFLQSASGLLTYAVAVATPASDLEPTDFEGLAGNMSNIPAGRSVTNGANSQVIFWNQLVVTGTLINAGEMRIGPWPF